MRRALPLIAAVGLDLDSASAQLRAAGFSDIPYGYDGYGSPKKGAVVRLDPASGQVQIDTPMSPVLAGQQRLSGGGKVVRP
jgi:hypothetical protein